MPSWPWTYSAPTHSRIRGRSQPGNTGTSPPRAPRRPPPPGRTREGWFKRVPRPGRIDRLCGEGGNVLVRRARAGFPKREDDASGSREVAERGGLALVRRDVVGELQERALERFRRRRRGVEDRERPLAACHLERPPSRLDRDLELDEADVRSSDARSERVDVWRAQGRKSPRREHDGVVPPGFDGDGAGHGRQRHTLDAGRVDALRFPELERAVAELVLADGRQKAHLRAETRRTDGLVRTFAAVIAMEVAADNRLAELGRAAADERQADAVATDDRNARHVRTLLRCQAPDMSRPWLVRTGSVRTRR